MVEGKKPEPTPQVGEGTPEPKGGGEGTVPQSRLDQEVKRRHEAEEKLSAFQKSQEEAGKKVLEEQNKYKELYEQEKQKVAQLTPLEAAIKGYHESEIADLSDEQKALIPNLPMHEQLNWVKKAKTSGFLKSKDQKPNPPGTFDKKPVTNLPPDKWYLGLEANDPRLAQLPSEKYIEWKNYRSSQKPAQPIGLQGRGGF